ncbi:hypothetical protein [Sporosarcina sp. FSL W7-1283]|uniref:hypothetical protein n=1 Tax=Sporosarcina sp. FSL W7-1283 TaxID=2921560 RepID=UPI0030FB49E6
MAEPTNAVLAEQVRQLRKDFHEFRNATKDELKEMEEKVDNTRRIADEVNYSVKYVKSAVDKMEDMMSNFINVVNQQNDKIDDFVNSDKRLNSRRQFVVSVLQVASGIIIALITFWATGKM